MESKSAISVFGNEMKDVKGMTERSDNSKRRSGPLGISGGTWRLLIIPVLLIMILPLGVNAMMFRNDSSHSGIYNDNGITPTNVLKWSSTTQDAVYATPAVENGRVFVGSNDNFMYAYNATTGAVLWDFDAGGDIDSSAAVVNGVVYFGSYDHKVYALDAANGGDHWVPFTTSNIIRSSPAVAGGYIYIGNDDGVIYAINAETGEERWHNSTNTTPMPPFSGMHSSPAVANGNVYVGSEDSKIYALNATTGVRLWSYTTGSPIISSPAVDANGIVYIGSQDGYLYALDAEVSCNGGRHPISIATLTQVLRLRGMSSISGARTDGCMPLTRIMEVAMFQDGLTIQEQESMQKMPLLSQVLQLRMVSSM